MGDESRQPNRLRSGVVRPNTLSSTAPGPVPARYSAPARRRARSGKDAALFGPNTDAVLALLRAVSALGPVDARRLTSFWRAESPEVRRQAHVAAQAAAEASGRREAARSAQREAMHWLDARPRAGGNWGPDLETAGTARDWAQIRREAFPAVVDAVAATVLSSVLDPAADEVLLRPWREAFG